MKRFDRAPSGLTEAIMKEYLPAILRNEKMRGEVIGGLLEKQTEYLYDFLNTFHQKLRTPCSYDKDKLFVEFDLETYYPMNFIKITFPDECRVAEVYIAFQIEQAGGIENLNYFFRNQYSDVYHKVNGISEGMFEIFEHENWDRSVIRTLYGIYFCVKV